MNPLTHIDLADDVTVTFSGICPKVYAEITIKKDQPYSSDINFFYLDSEWIRSELGDRYEKEISYDEKAVKKDGYIVDNATIQYTIEGLPTYNFTFEDLSAATLEELEKESGACGVGSGNCRYILDRKTARYVFWMVPCKSGN